MRNMATVSQIDGNGLGPRKTFFIMVTLVGCIAILWPKVFYPMMFGGVPKQNLIKDHRGTGLRQERPPHLRPDTIHPAMRERGRAIPSTQTVPVVERTRTPSSPPRIVEGRPGPIPGMRPPMGAGSVHQAQPKGSNMGFIMPLYTVGIVAFFIYTVMRIVFKKRVANAPYAPARQDPKFRQEVFENESIGYKRPDDGTTKLGDNNQQVYDYRNYGRKHINGEIIPSCQTSYKQCTNVCNGSGAAGYNAANPTVVQPLKDIHNREQEQLLEIEKLRKKLEDTEKAMAKIIAEMGCDPYKAKVPFYEENRSGKCSYSEPNTLASHEALKFVTAIQGLIDAADEQLKRREQSASLSKELPENLSQNGNISNGHATSFGNCEPNTNVEKLVDIKEKSDEFIKTEKSHEQSAAKKRDENSDRTVKVLGMEMTLSCEGGQKWNRPPTPNLFAHSYPHSADELEEDPHPEPQSIYLEGSLPHESKILVADSETRTEKVVDDEFEGTSDEPAVVLSSKMTLSLINLNALCENEEATSNNKDKDSPIDQDIEIINGEESEIKNVEHQ